MIVIKKIGNGFIDCYYLTEDGEVFNSDTGTYLKRQGNSFKLKTVEGKYKSINLKDLFSLVFNKVYCNDAIVSLDNEEWREIPQTQGLYYCSNLGRVKSLKGYNAKLMNPFKTKEGYLRVSLFFDGVRKDLLLHRIVAMCFLTPPPQIDYVIHHKDLNKKNCSLDNLMWIEPREHQTLHNKIMEMKTNGKG